MTKRKNPKIKPNKKVRADLVDSISKKAGLSYKKTEAIVSAIADFTAEQLIDGFPVEIPNLGTLSLKRDTPKRVRSWTGEWVVSTPHRLVRLVPSQALLDLVAANRGKFSKEPEEVEEGNLGTAKKSEAHK